MIEPFLIAFAKAVSNKLVLNRRCSGRLFILAWTEQRTAMVGMKRPMRKWDATT
ncbi:hypothetical protein PMIN01_09590 [Paraphaeosphaeria minitans]|uniref:Uncharacterized protein n=1 Tax=Paraphaeosphaeria minitans TaxID=565426 RepID=A0A9P6GBX8_9PLEO|nr:hypothetical protein PMIN01_09590 [Paraphaeosphaeria minitans]